MKYSMYKQWKWIIMIYIALGILVGSPIGVSAQTIKIERLIQELNNSDWDNRMKAEEALAEIGNQAVEPLIAALKNKHEKVRLHAAGALGRIGNSKAVKPLITILEGKKSDYDVKNMAIWALGRIGEPAVKPLIAALKDKNWHGQNKVAEALDKIGWKPSNESDKLLHLAAKREWSELVKVGNPATEVLVAALRNEPDSNVQQDAAEALGKIGNPEPLIAVLKDGNENARDRSAWVLGWMEDVRAVDPLIAALKDKSDDVREVAATALGKIGDARAIEPLLAAMKDESENVREDAAEALGKIGDARAITPLEEFIKTMSGGTDKDNLKRALARIKKQYGK